jgi:hypothetical protein
MPSARPIPVSMFVANTDSGNACPTSDSSPSATVIEMIADSNGTRPATTEPNTISSTINAAGNPNPSSPLRRSSPASVSKSDSSVCSPVMVTSNPSRPSAARTASTTSSMSSSASRPSATSSPVASRSLETSRRSPES